MSSYIPHYTKKRQILRRKEQNLRRLIQRGAGKEKLFRAAEEVRAQRIRVLKAERATVPPMGGPQAHRFDAIDNKIEALLAMPLEAILAEFKAAVPAESKARD
jgi:hypothetical protein